MCLQVPVVEVLDASVQGCTRSVDLMSPKLPWEEGLVPALLNFLNLCHSIRFMADSLRLTTAQFTPEFASFLVTIVVDDSHTPGHGSSLYD